MQDRKKSSSIFNFNKKQITFFKRVLVFFIPVVIAYAVLEVLVLQLPFQYTIIEDYMASEGDRIEIITTGSSQMKCAVNPAFMKEPALNFGSTSQHHNTDYAILTQTHDKLKNVNCVVLEVSYSHLELPHNAPTFWKNNVYLKYYDVNNFGRNTYFKDKLIFLSRPDIYSRELIDHYVRNKTTVNFNRFGFDENNYNGSFKKKNYEDAEIPFVSSEINTSESVQLFEYNTAFLFKFLDYLEAKNINVVLTSLPMHKYYLRDRNLNILHRRDSILTVASERYSNLRVFRKEEDTVHFKTSDYINHNHLNPDGAKKYTEMLDAFIAAQNFQK